MKNIAVERAAGLIAAQLPTGAFLCVDGRPPNVMTIGWGGLSYFWARPVFIAPVRPQRHTYGLMETADAFAVCVPAPGMLAHEVARAGTLSGRDGNKFEAIGLQTGAARRVAAPIVDGCALYLECVIRAKNAFSMPDTDSAIANTVYAGNDYHVLYYGEIVACYGGGIV